MEKVNNKIPQLTVLHGRGIQKKSKSTAVKRRKALLETLNRRQMQHCPNATQIPLSDIREMAQAVDNVMAELIASWCQQHDKEPDQLTGVMGRAVLRMLVHRY